VTQACARLGASVHGQDQLEYAMVHHPQDLQEGIGSGGDVWTNASSLLASYTFEQYYAAVAAVPVRYVSLSSFLPFFSLSACLPVCFKLVDAEFIWLLSPCPTAPPPVANAHTVLEKSSPPHPPCRPPHRALRPGLVEGISSQGRQEVALATGQFNPSFHSLPHLEELWVPKGGDAPQEEALSTTFPIQTPPLSATAPRPTEEVVPAALPTEDKGVWAVAKADATAKPWAPAGSKGDRADRYRSNAPPQLSTPRAGRTHPLDRGFQSILPTPAAGAQLGGGSVDRMVAELTFKGGETAGISALHAYVWEQHGLSEHVAAEGGVAQSAGCRTSLVSPWLLHGCVSSKMILEQCTVLFPP
jgi:hypothetical protein